MGKKFFIIKSNTEDISKVVSRMINYIKESTEGQSEEYFFRIKVVLSEMITNSVIHGNHKNEKKRVTIQLYTCSQFIEAKIIDQGPPFKGCISVPDVENENGRGLLICHSFCDDIRYNFIDGVGNAAIIKFYRSH